MTKIICPHCPNIIEHTDTTCWQCGEQVDCASHPKDAEVKKSLAPFVWIGVLIWSMVGVFCLSNGWLS